MWGSFTCRGNFFCRIIIASIAIQLYKKILKLICIKDKGGIIHCIHCIFEGIDGSMIDFKIST